MRSATAYQPTSSINGGLGKSGRHMPEVVDVVADAMPEPGGPLVMAAQPLGAHVGLAWMLSMIILVFCLRAPADAADVVGRWLG
jgi:hypothetical protein